MYSISFLLDAIILKVVWSSEQGFLLHTFPDKVSCKKLLSDWKWFAIISACTWQVIDNQHLSPGWFILRIAY